MQKGGFIMEELNQDLYNDIHSLDTINGIVIKVTDKEAWIDLNYRIEGTLSLSDYSMKPCTSLIDELQVGDYITVKVIYVSDEFVRVSHKAVEQDEAFDTMLDKVKNHERLTITFTEAVKSGIVGKDRIDFFMPLSQVDMTYLEDASDFLNKPLEVEVLEYDDRKRRAIVSHRKVLEGHIADSKTTELSTLEVGQRLTLEVKEVLANGAVLKHNHLRYWLPIKQASHLFVKDLNTVLTVGESIEVEIIDIDREKENVVVSLKKVLPTPWEVANKTLAVDQIVTGTVTRITPFGAFIELLPGVEGLLHNTEFSYSPYVLLRNELHVGDVISIKVLKIDEKDNRIGLSVKQMDKDPWVALQEQHKVGDVVTAPIVRVTEFGCFVEIIPFIEALVPISEYSYNRRANLSESIQQGQLLTVKVIKIDQHKKQVAASIKQVGDDPWQIIQSKYKEGDIIETTITRLEDAYAFAMVEPDAEAIIFARDETDKPLRQSNELFSLGQAITAMVTSLEPTKQRMVLSVRANVDAASRAEFETYLQSQKETKDTLGDQFKDVFAKLKEEMGK